MDGTTVQTVLLKLTMTVPTKELSIHISTIGLMVREMITMAAHTLHGLLEIFRQMVRILRCLVNEIKYFPPIR